MKLKKLLLLMVLGCIFSTTTSFADTDPFVKHLDKMNERLADEGRNVKIHSMHLLGSGQGLNMGRTVFPSDRGNKQLSADWALNDPFRLDSDGNIIRKNITYAIDTAELTSDFSAMDQLDAIRFGLETWDKQKCSNIVIEEVPAPVPNIGFVGALREDGDYPVLGPLFEGGAADILHAGFKSGEAFSNIICGDPNPDPETNRRCGDGILGVTFTLTWEFLIGEFTDFDDNGKADTFTSEIYYNDDFRWTNNGTDDPANGVYDFATVALHESGHALSRAHFGDVSIHHKKGLQTSPKAVMNAIYSGVQRELRGPDKGGHCSDWGAWPKQN